MTMGYPSNSLASCLLAFAAYILVALCIKVSCFLLCCLL